MSTGPVPESAVTRRHIAVPFSFAIPGLRRYDLTVINAKMLAIFEHLDAPDPNCIEAINSGL